MPVENRSLESSSSSIISNVQYKKFSFVLYSFKNTFVFVGIFPFSGVSLLITSRFYVLGADESLSNLGNKLLMRIAAVCSPFESSLSEESFVLRTRSINGLTEFKVNSFTIYPVAV